MQPITASTHLSDLPDHTCFLYEPVPLVNASNPIIGTNGPVYQRPKRDAELTYRSVDDRGQEQYAWLL